MTCKLPTADLRRALRCLRAAVPAGEVRVARRAPPGGLLGLTVLSAQSRATIYLRPDLDHEAAVATLTHEWAHVLAWRRHGTDIADHGDEWALAHGDAYRGLGAELDRRKWR